MIRKLLLPAIAVATLAGCVTQPGYRDVGYGHSRVEYRRIDPYGAYGYPPVYGYYGYYGSPYYGYPYGVYRPPHPPRPPHGSGHDGHHGGDHDGDHHDGDHPGHAQPPDPRDGDDRRPPWRNPRGMVERPRSDDRDVRQPLRAPPVRSQREPAPMPRVRSERAPSAMGNAVRRAESAARPRTSREHGTE